MILVAQVADALMERMSKWKIQRNSTLMELRDKVRQKLGLMIVASYIGSRTMAVSLHVASGVSRVYKLVGPQRGPCIGCTSVHPK